ncbi:anthrone oxygenase family protein [Streptomyces sp. NPDC046887]|uniref:anthrone oxygenase family protein n=1 Tax=Streptomyces sp. NPDC046887 TaxID=3155472 RepID=UPI0033F001FF
MREPIGGATAHPGPEAAAPRGDRWTGPLLLAATVAMGLMAGLFFAFDVSVMPGLDRLPDRRYAEAMQRFNEAIDGNGLFALVFLGALAATAAAAVLAHRAGRRPTARWAAAAAVLYLAVLVLTFAVNIPLNNELAALGDPAKAADLSVVADFRGRWEAVNIGRTLLCTAALGGLAHALRLHARAPRPR